jgi:hypothetical protein
MVAKLKNQVKQTQDESCKLVNKGGAIKLPTFGYSSTPPSLPKVETRKTTENEPTGHSIRTDFT